LTFTSFTQDCLLFATADWDTPYWTNKQHTAHHLALKGFRVLYIESIGLRPPTTNAKDLCRIWQRLKRGLRHPRQVESGVWVLSPIAIPFKQHWSLVRAFNQGWLKLRIKHFMLSHGSSSPWVWTYHPFMQGAIHGIACGPLVYHCVDDLSAVPGIDAEKFNAEEQSLLKQCDIVFVTSQALQDKCQPFNAATHYFPNVVDSEHFGNARAPGDLPADLACIPSPRIAYIGALSDFKVDFELIYCAAIARPQWHWILIGEEREGQRSEQVSRFKALNNVHLMGYKPYADLPNYLRGMNVGSLPTLINDYTKFMFPMKYFEYLAAGVPVVSTPLDFTKQHQQGLKIAHDTAGFISAIDEQLRRGKLTDAEVSSYVGENTWRARLEKMIGIVKGCQ
jgi:glycosyltransferase involved in cell wall biosynthesis